MSMILKGNSGINFKVDTVDDLLTLEGSEGEVVIVSDENRGGTFVYRSAEASTNNGGTVFNGWCRQYDGAVNVKWFGAVGDYNGTTGKDNTLAIQSAINLQKGVIFDSGLYYCEGSLDFSSLNSSNTYTDTFTSIEGNEVGIIINPTITTEYAIKFQACKKLMIKGLRITHNSFIEFNGLWESKFESCVLGNVKFSPNNIGTFDSHYWNTFENCQFGEIEFHTGTSSDRTEFNSNIFISCKIWGGEYAFKVYGNQNLQGNSFIQCDISYQTAGLLYIDENIIDGNMNFFGGYFDSSLGFPIDTQGIKINTYGTVNAPNSANMDSFLLSSTGSFSQADTTSGVRNGSRLPTSSLNLFKDGDLSSGTLDYLVNSGATSSIESGDGFFGNYARFSSNLTRAVGFSSIPVPFDGWYSVTVIGRITEGSWQPSISVNGSTTNYGAIKISSEITVSSYQVYLNTGDVANMLLSSTTGQANSIDLFYGSLTLGRFGSLGSTLHPDCNFMKKDYEEIGLKKEYLLGTADTDTVIKDILVPTYRRYQLEITLWCSDGSYPDGSMYAKYSVLMSRGSGAISLGVTQISASEVGTTTGVPIITITEDTSGIASIKLTMPNGSATYRAELFGSY